MELKCVWEHNGEDSILYVENLTGAFTRGPSREAALAKLPGEAAAYFRWLGKPLPAPLKWEIVQEKASKLMVRDADSDVLFEKEREPLQAEEYQSLKELALRSAEDFLTLYEAVPDKDKSCLPFRESFYGPIPRTAREMYEHTKNVNSYYFSEIGVEADNEGTILSCRQMGFALAEKDPALLAGRVFRGSYEEDWSLRKVLRRFIWHDRIHAKAMYRMAERTFGLGAVPDVFRFNG